MSGFTTIVLLFVSVIAAIAVLGTWDTAKEARRNRIEQRKRMAQDLVEMSLSSRLIHFDLPEKNTIVSGQLMVNGVMREFHLDNEVTLDAKQPALVYLPPDGSGRLQLFVQVATGHEVQ